jgi:hypothetical protein
MSNAEFSNGFFAINSTRNFILRGYGREQFFLRLLRRKILLDKFRKLIFRSSQFAETSALYVSASLICDSMSSVIFYPPFVDRHFRKLQTSSAKPMAVARNCCLIKAS